MGTRWSRGGPPPERRQRERREEDSDNDSLDGLVRREDIAQFPYVEFTGRDSITCPTCQGTGRIPSGQVNELVALIPYSDQRLRPQRTKLYVVLSVVLCLLASSLVAFFLFPRSVVVVDDGIHSVTVRINPSNMKVLMNMTPEPGTDTRHTEPEPGTDTRPLEPEPGTDTRPLSQSQVNFTVSVEIGSSAPYVYAFCTMPSIKVHNIVVCMQTTVKTSYMVRSSQNSLEAYRYIDCGSNTTRYRADRLPPSLSSSSSSSSSLPLLL
ncbi:Transmembrane protein 106B [Liparis tanakae]|uniref:Transmembrane protein 106B n=1 Tax=Liparis tanakae TaxID=230148 RepID=A0A4Z2F8M7_9TELE|nr:Transmembrane protein 106B [Liparis tanakae]